MPTFAEACTRDIGPVTNGPSLIERACNIFDEVM
jgi:hypothetical protein